MDTQDILKKVRKIEIKTRGLSQNIFAGQYHSAFKGRGMAFSEVREYQYGDDIRNIDRVRNEVGMVFQHFNLFPHLTVLQNCTLAPIWVKKMPKKES